jgi:hypothetical protein
MADERPKVGKRIGARWNLHLEIATAVVPRRVQRVVRLETGDVGGPVECHRENVVSAGELDRRA